MRQHGARVLSERDRRLLRFIGEQYLVTLPQLGYLADRSQRTARWLRTRWQRAGLVGAAPLLVDEATIVWLTRLGLASLGLPWKEVRPSFHTVETAAALVELRLAATAQYPAARWVSRRALAHAQALEPPLPDALLETDTTAVAVIVKLRPLDRRELEGRVAPILDRHDHTLLVLPSLSEQAREWIDERMGRTTAIAYRRDARVVAAPLLPPLPSLEHDLAEPSKRPVEAEAGAALLRQREVLLAEAREEIAAHKRRRLGRVSIRHS